jgi:hypothetical protein
MTEYEAGSLKRDPVSKAVAVRTVYPADGWNAWGVMTTDRGGHFASHDEVAEWPDVTV